MINIDPPRPFHPTTKHGQLLEQPVAERSGAAANAAASSRPTANIGHIPSLDGLRALSVALVFLAHTGLERAVPGGLGVTIFFFLSGYLITTLMRAEFARDGAVHLGHFWLRRCLRILPPFYLVLAFALLTHLLLRGTEALSVSGTLAQLLHVSNYWIVEHGYNHLAEGSGVYWSLAVEEHFYLLFPWLFVTMQRRQMTGRHQAVLLWSLCALLLAWRCTLVYGLGAPDDRTYLATDTRVDSILFGCAVALFHNPVIDKTPVVASRWKWGYLPLAGVILLASLAVRDASWRATFRYSVQGVALSLIFIAAIRFPQWLVFRPLNWKPVAFLGVLSYSFYLVHQVIIFGMRSLAPGAGWAPTTLVCLVISMALAYGIYVWVELPCARFRRRLTD